VPLLFLERQILHQISARINPFGAFQPNGVNNTSENNLITHSLDLKVARQL